MRGSSIGTDAYLVAVLGPTASGKSTLAEGLAAARSGSLLNADAFAVYRELSVGVTKPSLACRQRFDYRLLDIVTLEEGLDVVRYRAAFEHELQAVCEIGRLPILVGGVGLYTESVLERYRPPAVEVPEEVRTQVRSLEIPEALERLARLDPSSYNRIDRANPRRVYRALELAEAQGGPVAPGGRDPRNPRQTLRLYLDPDRELLKARIAARAEAMWEPWLEEVLELEKKGLLDALEVRQPIGYDFVLDHLQGRLNETEAKARIVAQTAALAKRQRTWMRRALRGSVGTRVALERVEDWDSMLERALELLDRHRQQSSLRSIG